MASVKYFTLAYLDLPMGMREKVERIKSKAIGGQANKGWSPIKPPSSQQLSPRQVSSGIP